MTKQLHAQAGDVERDMSTDTLENKNLLVVNVGSLGKRFILEAIKSFRLRVIALQNHRVDWAEEFVDEWIIVPPDASVATVKAEIHRFTQDNDMTLDGAITFWEEEVPMVAHICEEFGLAGNSVETAMKTRSKYDMQEALRQKEEPAIPQYLLHHENDLEEAMHIVGFPAVIKPLFGSDSQSVVYVNSPEEARKVCQEVLCYSNNYEELFKYEEGAAVYQKYIPGREFSVECYAQNGVPGIAGINEKLPMKLPYFMEAGDIAPAQISPKEQEVLEREARITLAALEIRNSLAHIEMKLTPEGTPYIIEAASRMGGAYIQKTTRTAYDFDLIRAGCEIAVRIPVSEKSVPTGKHARAQIIIPETSGVVTGVQGRESLNDPRVLSHDISVSSGTVINVPPKGYDTAGWILVEGDSHEEAKQIMTEVTGKLDITIEETKAS